MKNLSSKIEIETYEFNGVVFTLFEPTLKQFLQFNKSEDQTLASIDLLVSCGLPEDLSSELPLSAALDMVNDVASSFQKKT